MNMGTQLFLNLIFNQGNPQHPSTNQLPPLQQKTVVNHQSTLNIQMNHKTRLMNQLKPGTWYSIVYCKINTYLAGQY